MDFCPLWVALNVLLLRFLSLFNSSVPQALFSWTIFTEQLKLKEFLRDISKIGATVSRSSFPSILNHWCVSVLHTHPSEERWMKWVMYTSGKHPPSQVLIKCQTKMVKIRTFFLERIPLLWSLRPPLRTSIVSGCFLLAAAKSCNHSRNFFGHWKMIFWDVIFLVYNHIHRGRN